MKEIIVKIDSVNLEIINDFCEGEGGEQPVELIRCRDCKHHHYDGHGIPYCDRKDYGYGWTDDDFCSKSERKE